MYQKFFDVWKVKVCLNTVSFFTSLFKSENIDLSQRHFCCCIECHCSSKTLNRSIVVVVKYLPGIIPNDKNNLFVLFE